MSAKFTNFSDKSEVVRARHELMTRFSAEAKELGLNIDLGRITYNEDELRCKLTVTLADKKPAEVQFSPSVSQPIVGQTFMFRRKQYTITQFAWNSPKYPVIAKNANGKEYKFPLSAVNA